MKLYFQSTGRKRLFIDTDKKTYSNNYYLLGGWREYIKISDAGIREITAQAINDGYKLEDQK
jgi:hypothetical protein